MIKKITKPRIKCTCGGVFEYEEEDIIQETPLEGSYIDMLLWAFEPMYDYVYCPYCGKRIKI